MQSVIGRLKNDGWILSDFKIGTDASSGNKDYGEEIKINWISYTFSKPNIIHNKDEYLPNKKELTEYIQSSGIAVTDIDIDDSEAIIYFDSYALDGELPTKSACEYIFDATCDIFGFTDYDLYYDKLYVIFGY